LFAQKSFQSFEFAIISRHGEKMIGEVRSLQNFEVLKAFVLFGSYHYHGGFPVFGHSLRFAARSLNDLAEPILGILDRPTSTNHGLTSSS
jgi:hypothetical protein